MSTDEYCCLGFKETFEQRFDRTLFVFADPPDEVFDKPTFWFAMRSVEKDKIDSVLPSLPEALLTLSTRKPISFCPWCGIKLAKFYKKKFLNIHDATVSEEFALPTSE